MSEEFTALESAMYNMGLTTATSRFVAITAATDAILFAAKPAYFFDTTGATKTDVMIPWWAVGVVTGAAAALFL
jgi:hypothetical protein